MWSCGQNQRAPASRPFWPAGSGRALRVGPLPPEGQGAAGGPHTLPARILRTSGLQQPRTPGLHSSSCPALLPGTPVQTGPSAMFAGRGQPRGSGHLSSKVTTPPPPPAMCRRSRGSTGQGHAGPGKLMLRGRLGEGSAARSGPLASAGGGGSRRLAHGSARTLGLPNLNGPGRAAGRTSQPPGPPLSVLGASPCCGRAGPP